jgi:3,4-dihydroxy-9,10-secoandrosta-1,3,5(10)-triene-9,17-dione 4,5-dioxygenase
VNRLTVRRSDNVGIIALGWELRGIADVELVAETLTKCGYDVQLADRELAEQRRVAALATVADPSGNRLEFFVGARTEEVRQFISPTGARFVTGEFGVGHVTVATSRYDEMLDFYTRILGFYVSDFLVGDSLQAAFLSPNGRHHSIALIDTHGAVDAYDHFMVEVDELAMVGRAYDRCLELGAPLTYTLGKHWNDHMTSFYVQSPSGFDIEYGWNGRVVDRAKWSAVQGNGEISIWGHHPTSAELAQKRGLSSWVEGLALKL